MASLQLINGVFHIRFRLSRKAHRRTLDTSIRDDAEALKKQVEVNLHRIGVGIIPLPPIGADVPRYVLSGGKECGNEYGNAACDQPQQVTLLKLRDDYFESLPEGAKESNSLDTERTHMKHLLRILKEKLLVNSLGTDELQRYINKRAKESGQRGKVKARTITKEISTFRNIWNNYALPRKIVDKDFRSTFGKFSYPKDQERPPFQTWEQIERQIDRDRLSLDEINAAWECLFLDTERIRQVLEYVHSRAGRPLWMYPAFVAAAHTGCRRGEILRSELNDWDIAEGVTMPMVRWREKKRDRTKEFTFRQVSITPFLRKVMTEWFDQHPGGKFAFCHSDGQPITVDDASHAFESMLSGVKWEKLRGWHIFRHSFVSCMAMKGIDQRIIDSSVGHQTDEMRRRYRHLFPQKQHEVLASVFSEG